MKVELNVPQHERTSKAARLERYLTPRKKNRAHERTMSFLDENGNWVNAVAIVDGDGKIVNLMADSEKLDLIIEELKKLNLQLSILTGS